MSDERMRASEARAALVREKGIEALVGSQPQAWLSPETVAKRPDLVERVRTMLAAASREGFAGCSEAIRSAGLDDHLGAVKVPALFVAADQDPALPAEVLRAMHQRLPGSEFATIANAGHLACLEQPDAFNAVLVSFLGRQPRAAA